MYGTFKVSVSAIKVISPLTQTSVIPRTNILFPVKPMPTRLTLSGTSTTAVPFGVILISRSNVSSARTESSDTLQILQVISVASNFSILFGFVIKSKTSTDAPLSMDISRTSAFSTETTGFWNSIIENLLQQDPIVENQQGLVLRVSLVVDARCVHHQGMIMMESPVGTGTILVLVSLLEAMSTFHLLSLWPKASWFVL